LQKKLRFGIEFNVIQEKLNNRPKKLLNYLTPNEVVAKFIESGVVKP